MTSFEERIARDLLLVKIYELLDEEQTRKLLARLIEARIKEKQHHIDMMQHKVETYKLARDMVEADLKK